MLSELDEHNIYSTPSYSPTNIVILLYLKAIYIINNIHISFDLKLSEEVMLNFKCFLPLIFNI